MWQSLFYTVMWQLKPVKIGHWIDDFTDLTFDLFDTIEKLPCWHNVKQSSYTVHGSDYWKRNCLRWLLIISLFASSGQHCEESLASSTNEEVITICMVISSFPPFTACAKSTRNLKPSQSFIMVCIQVVVDENWSVLLLQYGVFVLRFGVFFTMWAWFLGGLSWVVRASSMYLTVALCLKHLVLSNENHAIKCHIAVYVLFII